MKEQRTVSRSPETQQPLPLISKWERSADVKPKSSGVELQRHPEILSQRLLWNQGFPEKTLLSQTGALITVLGKGVETS